MVRIRAQHPYHEPKTQDPDSVCGECGKATPQVCGWCGVCADCHKGIKDGKQDF